MQSQPHDRTVIVLTDVAGEHYWTESEMFFPIVEAWPVPADVQAFTTAAEADRQIAVQAAKGVHLRRRVMRANGQSLAFRYRVAVVAADGSFEVIDRFTAVNDQAANDYAERHHPDADWYVLDDTGRNINGGRDQE